MRRHLDLCSGIGGFSLAAEWAGLTTIGFAEIDDYASRVLKKHWPHVPNYGDIANVPRLENVYLLTAGFPCQPYSVAGKRKGASDDRAIWPQVCTVIERTLSRWVLLENVPGILSLNGELEFERICSALERQSYEVQPIVIPAAAVNAKHRRDRVWIAAYSECSGWRKQLRTKAASGALSQTVGQEGAFGSGSGREDAAHTAQRGMEEQRLPAEGRILVADTNGRGEANGYPASAGLPDWAGGTVGRPSPLTEFERPSGREVERDFCGVAHGVSARVDRLRCLGNAIVPQVAYHLIKRMIEAEESLSV